MLHIGTLASAQLSAGGGGGAPDRALVLNGKYLLLNGSFLYLGA